MQLIRSKTAFYPLFQLGSQPSAIQCELQIVEANGKRYLKTPFAMLDAFADDDIERVIDGRQYYPTAEAVGEHLRWQYPNWRAADPIMDALFSAMYRSAICGAGQVADRCGVSIDRIHQLARGDRSFTLKQIKDAVKNLYAPKVPA